MAHHGLGVGAILFAKPLPSRPVVVLPQYVVVDVLEKLELDRLAEPFDRLQSVKYDATRPSRELLIEKPGGTPKNAREFGLPFVPLLGLQVRLCHAASLTGHGSEIIPDRPRKVPSSLKINSRRQRIFAQVPREQTRGIIGVILGITATR